MKTDLGQRISIDSRTWTGLYHGRNYNQRVRASGALRHRVGWWLAVSFKKLVCPHDWSMYADACDICGLTREAAFDHSFNRLPRYVAVSVGAF